LYDSHKKGKPKCKGLKKKVNHIVSDSILEIRKLEKIADALFQLRGKELYPKSVVKGGKPTEVIHHFVPKSQSNNLRYDFRNACPATNGQHYRHHECGDPTLTNAFRKNRGQKWIDDLEVRRHIICKHTKEYLESVIERLSTRTPFDV
jgi:5-methylcytosine-specific restriction endonuclease McrA